MSFVSLLAWGVYVGGIGAAYRKDRKHFGRLRAGFEAFAWPCGLGFRLARDFYRNEDWPGEKR